MLTLSNELLENILEKNKKHAKDGHVATYIPGLAKVDPNLFGIAVANISNKYEEFTAGDFNVKFAIESISKVLSLALVIKENGIYSVFDKIDIEPTHFAFNSILNMEIRGSKRPTNPFINAGAIAVTSLIKGKTQEDKLDNLLNFIRLLSNNNDIYVNKNLADSEEKTGDQNRSLAYYMKAHDMIEGNVDDILDLYFKQCSIEVTCLDLARISAVLANGGIAPWNNKEILSSHVTTIIKSLMTTCGLYDESGSFAVNIGIPSKSGVGGGILSSVPHKMGIGIFSPPLDPAGNSLAGTKVLTELSTKLDLNIFK